MHHSPLTFARAFLCLIGLTRDLDEVAESDFRRETTNRQGAQTPTPAQLEEIRASCQNYTIKRMEMLRRKTIVSFGWTASAVAAAATILAPQQSSISSQAWFAITSVVCFSAGTLGRLGWNQGSFSSATVYEELDAIFFWTLYWIGTFTGIAALFGEH